MLKMCGINGREGSLDCNKARQSKRVRKSLMKIIKNKWSKSILLMSIWTLPYLAMAQISVGTQQAQGVDLSSHNILYTLGVVLRWMLAAVGVLGILSFVTAGLMFLLSGGDEEKVKSAKNAMVYAIVGVVVSLLGLIVVTTVSEILSPSGSVPMSQ